MIRILVVSGDIHLNKIVCSYLNHSGFEAKSCCDLQATEQLSSDHSFELVVTDMIIPKMNEFSFAKNSDSVKKTVPILLMSTKDDLLLQQKEKKWAADDYIIKPIDLDELFLRVRTLLQRANLKTSSNIMIGNLKMDTDTMSVIIGEATIPLTAKEFNILYKLLSYPHNVFSQIQLLEEFWGGDLQHSQKAVEKYMIQLQDKCSGWQGFKIVTIKNSGYQVVPQ